MAVSSLLTVEWDHVLAMGETSIVRFPDPNSQNDRTWDTEMPAGVQVPKFGGGGVRMWMGVWKGGRTDLSFYTGSMTAASNGTISKGIIIPTCKRNELLLLHDGEGSHTAKRNQAPLKTAGVETVLPNGWPGNSPDLTVIENLNTDLKERCSHYKTTPLAELRRVAQREWKAIPRSKIANCFDSTEARLKAVRAARGGHTRY